MAKSLTKSETVSKLADMVGKATKSEVSKKQVSVFLDSLATLAYKEAKNTFSIPGLLKIVTVTKPAVPARMGINPFTKQEQMFKAKPARKVVKIRALKALKDAVK